MSGIFRSYQRQRLVELVQRERIAMIERGVEPGKLPAVLEHALALAFGNGAGDERILVARRRQRLIIAGLVFAFFGLALALLLGQVAGNDNVWAVGAIPFSIGAALLLGSRAVKMPV